MKDFGVAGCWIDCFKTDFQPQRMGVGKSRLKKKKKVGKDVWEKWERGKKNLSAGDSKMGLKGCRGNGVMVTKKEKKEGGELLASFV